MATSYEAAIETLYRGSLDTFVAERKRLANELKAGGDKEAASRLVKLGRPSISAWAVNQLWWNERDTFERLLATAERLKRGELEAGAEHQRALSALRSLAAARLESGGHAAPESTLRRVTTTLSALAVAGGFDPDPPGALVGDRDPPGFEAIGIVAATVEQAPKLEQKREQAEQERKRAAEERRRLEEEQAKKSGERQRLESAHRAAQSLAAMHQREVERLRDELGLAEKKLETAEATVAELKAALEKMP